MSSTAVLETVARYYGDQYLADMRYCACPEEPSIRKAWDAYQELTRETREEEEE